MRPLRGAGLLRALHGVVPLGRKYHPLVSLFNSRHGLRTIPFGPYQLVQPAGWRKQQANLLLLQQDIVPEFRLLEPVCRQLKRGLIVDVGANIGVYTLLLRAASELPIVSYEPQPFLFDLLKLNVEFNHLPNVTVHRLACGAERGEVPFAIGINGAVASGADTAASTSDAASADWEAQAELTREGRAVVKVPVTTLDEELANEPAVALIKIDCEGFEQLILKGARQTLERHRPHVFIELHPGEIERFGGSPVGLVSMLSPAYEMEFWTFQHDLPKSKLGRSLAKFASPKAHRYATAEEMFAALNAPPRPSQVYVVARPR